VLLETYQRYESVADRQREILLTFAPISATVLLLLLLLQLPLGDRMVRQLREGEAERSGLQARAADASTDERRRIAGSLHDGIVQDLAAASYVLSGATDRLATRALQPEETADVTARLRTAEGTVRGSVSALRSLLIEIYPPHLAQAGLPAALRGLGDRLQPRDVRLRIDVPDVVDVPEETAALVFRVAQEALINVGRHARAHAVHLSLTTAPDRVLLEITDDGVGFDPSESAGEGHFGLRVLTDLAAAAGATLDLATAPGSGTALRLEVPLP
jgi:signal transduction histidine kinase